MTADVELLPLSQREVYDESFWQEGIAGGANVVTYNGEDVRGVCRIEDDNTRRLVINQHNAAIRNTRANLAPLQAENERLRVEVRDAYAAADSKAGWEWKKRAEQAEARAERLRVELDEQCRLHAIGMERELKLINERDRLLKEALVLNERAERLKEALEMMVEMVEMNGFGKAAAMDTARAALAKENL